MFKDSLWICDGLQNGSQVLNGFTRTIFVFAEGSGIHLGFAENFKKSPWHFERSPLHLLQIPHRIPQGFYEYSWDEENTSRNAAGFSNRWWVWRGWGNIPSTSTPETPSTFLEGSLRMLQEFWMIPHEYPQDALGNVKDSAALLINLIRAPWQLPGGSCVAEEFLMDLQPIVQGCFKESPMIF